MPFFTRVSCNVDQTSSQNTWDNVKNKTMQINVDHHPVLKRKVSEIKSSLQNANGISNSSLM